MAQEIRLTHGFIDKYTLPESGRVSIRDSEIRGLQIQISFQGSRVWYWVGRVRKRAQRIRIGSYPEFGVDRARREAQRIRTEIAEGKAPTTPKKLSDDAMTLGRLFEWYFVNLSQPHKSTSARDRQRFERYFPHWRHTALIDIKRQAVRTLHTEIGATRGKVAANDALTLLGLLYRVAQDELDLPVINPVRGIKRYKVESRDRFLNGEELARLFDALDEFDHTFKDFVYLCLWTGARRSNVMGLEWSEVNLETGVWSVPASKAKNRKPMKLVLPQLAKSILQKRAEFCKGRYVFPSTRSRTGHYVEPKTAWASLIEKAALPGVRLHDLRRTFASFQAANNVSLQIIGKSLGHASTSSTEIYARLHLDSVREAVDAATQAMNAAAEKNLRKSE